MPTFDEVNKIIPKASKGAKHSNLFQVYPDVRVKTPGVHGPTDFVVEVDCDNAGWEWRKFTHEDIFADLDAKAKADENFMQFFFAPALARIVVEGADPRDALSTQQKGQLPGVRPYTLLEASQVLAVAEHRRYARFEARGGGRFLPARFAMGIIFGHWKGEEASALQKSGSNGLQILEKTYGVPPLLKDLV